MTSESEVLKTNEFLRRRTLRLQQVREQSKDIAKKLRQRAKVEKLRHIANLDGQKERDYLQQQEKLVKRLEQLYAQGVTSVGASHQKASGIKPIDPHSPEKEDLSKKRGKEAAAILKRKKQEKLDLQKKLLDRKLLAREAANEISREKSSSVANKLQTKSSSNVLPEDTANPVIRASKEKDNGDTDPNVNKNDMATQWDYEEIPNEWEPNVPALALPKDDRESTKESNNIPESKSEKSKRLDLFALSSEMPSSLRGGLGNVAEERTNVTNTRNTRPSLTMISEYLQNRALRLRETETTSGSSKKHDDLHSLRQTILHTRSSKIEGSLSNNVCHVLDEQVIPVPAWQAENCEFCAHSISHHNNMHDNECRQFTVTNSQINKIFSSIRPVRTDLHPSPVIRDCSPFRRYKVCQRTLKKTAKRNVNKSLSSEAESMLTKKNSVTIYNHSTRNIRDIPYGDPGLVVRDDNREDDAYAQALKEISNDNTKEREHLKKLQDMRSKVAMTKQTVEKEYNDTMSFLKSMPKEKCSKHILKTSYMDDKRQQMQKDRRQQKLQQEFNKIDKEHRKSCGLNSKSKNMSGDSTNKSRSPARIDLSDNEFENRDLQYSWMPVPEGDGNLAIHTIPTKLKEGKSGNTVKFSKVDSYHEYRSRHKHTPPTKDTSIDRQTNKKTVETVLIQNDDSETLDSISSSDTSSVENMNLQKKNDRKHKKTLTEEDKIIIYKILNSKKDKERKKLKLIDDVAKVLTAMDKEKLITSKDGNNNKHNKSSGVSVPMEHLNEGVYKVVNEKGLSYNVTSCYTANLEMWQTRAVRKPWWDNITSLYFSDNPQKGHSSGLTDDDLKCGKPTCSNKIKKYQTCAGGTTINCEGEDESTSRTPNCLGCQCGCMSKSKPKSNENTLLQPSAATSTSSFKTAATIDKGYSALPDDGFIKLLDDGGKEAGKFYIGTSGFLKDDAYEVIIQLRKKESAMKEAEKEYAKKLCDNVITEEIVATLQELNMHNNLSTPPSEPLSAKEVSRPGTESKLHKFQEPQQNLSNSDHSLKNKETLQEGTKKTTSSTNSNKESMQNPVKTFADKGVYTTSQLSFALPSDFPKTDATSRPATSTYTQTTMNSPNSRPVYIHMSSSTSTAYMSPPEIILPKYLKRNYKEFNRQATSCDEQHTVTDHAEYDRDSTCTCMRCLDFENIKINKENTNVKYSGHKKMTTPPYTARKSVRSIHRNCRKSKGRASSHTDINCRNHKRKLNIPIKKISSRNFVMRVNYNNLKSNTNDKDQKTNLNPVIRKYVNKLLDLNSNGLKAIEVANQECSSVSTPGSSIIDVPRNINDRTPRISNKISLEQIKNVLKQQILEECIVEASKVNGPSLHNRNKRSEKCLLKVPRTKRSVHKVKSLNISRKILKEKNCNNVLYPTTKPSCSTSSPSSTRDVILKPAVPSVPNKSKNRSKSSPPRIDNRFEFSNDSKPGSDTSDFYNGLSQKRGINIKNKVLVKHYPKSTRSKANDFILPLHKATITSPDSVNDDVNNYQNRANLPNNTSTQTRQDIDSEINLVKIAEDKIQNMEKIADLTERCTKRLSNLAKVLEEVRKNKSLVYSHISTSDTASDSEHKSDKHISVTAQQSCNPVAEVQNKSSGTLSPSERNDHANERKISSHYIPFLQDIPKPEDLKYLDSQSTSPTETKNIEASTHSNSDNVISKARGKPPPALSRITLKHGHDIIPHELSTVVEVDSPMSVKLKKQSSKGDVTDNSNQIIHDKDKEEMFDQDINKKAMEFLVNPDLLQNNNFNVTKRQKSSNDSSDDSKIQMMDLKQFNEVMLKPFITLQEYAKQCEVGMLDEGSNIDDNIREDLVNDDLSSLHSDGSLPDVIAELLKRNVIAEPFKFDTVSNVNSTTVSSESTLSVLALSKVRKDKRKYSVVFKNKENISETSDTLSISSNPDLENAFKKLGMGWASSTLKKTKERLALSSSSNTSSSSLTQFKMKHLNNQDVPALVTDSVSSASKAQKKHNHDKEPIDSAKNAEQQTSFMNSMTVKEFLTHELAKKITFTNKSNRNDTDEEFVSLLETKMPEEMKHSSQSLRGEHSVDSLPNASNTRARTSTPVQIFKSMTYHSSSSSNVSNGLFSNADDLSSVKGTSNSLRNHSTSDKDDLTIPNCSLRVKKVTTDCSKSD